MRIEILERPAEFLVKLVIKKREIYLKKYWWLIIRKKERRRYESIRFLTSYYLLRTCDSDAICLLKSLIKEKEEGKENG